MPGDGLEDLLRLIRQSNSKCNVTISEWEQGQREGLQAKAGKDFSKIESSAVAALSYLRHRNPVLREVAIEVLLKKWRSSVEFRSHLDRLAAEDPDPHVRRCAIYAIGHCFARTGNPSVGKRLARIVESIDESCEIREAAYISLSIVNGIEGLDQIRTLVQFQFPQDVDWTLVNSLLIPPEESPPGP